MSQPYIKSTITSISDSGYKSIPEDDGFSILAAVYTSAGPLTKQKILSQTEFVNKYLTGTRILPSDNISAKYVYKLLETSPVYVIRACNTTILEGISSLGNEYLFDTDYKLLDEYYQFWVADNKIIKDESNCLVQDLHWDITKYNFYNSDNVINFNYGDSSVILNINGRKCELAISYTDEDNAIKITLNGNFSNLDLHNSGLLGDTLSVTHTINVKPRVTVVNDESVNVEAEGNIITYNLSSYDWNSDSRGLSDCSQSISFTYGDPSVPFYISGKKLTLDIMYKDNGNLVLFGYFKNVELDKGFTYDILSVNHNMTIIPGYYSLKIQQKSINEEVLGSIYDFYVGASHSGDNQVKISSDFLLSTLMENISSYAEYKNPEDEGSSINNIFLFDITGDSSGYNIVSHNPITFSDNLLYEQNSSSISVINSRVPNLEDHKSVINEGDYITLNGIKYIYGNTGEQNGETIISIPLIGEFTTIYSDLFFLAVMARVSPELYSGSIGIRMYDYTDTSANYIDYISKSSIRGLRIRNKNDLDFETKDMYTIEEGEEEDSGKITLIKNLKTTVDSLRGYEFLVADLANPFNKDTKEYKQVAFIWAKDNSISVDVASFNAEHGTEIVGAITIGTSEEFTSCEFFFNLIVSICENCYIETNGNKEYIYIPYWKLSVVKNPMHFDSDRVLYIAGESISTNIFNLYPTVTLYNYQNIREAILPYDNAEAPSLSDSEAELSSVGTLLPSTNSSKIIDPSKYSILDINKYLIYDYNIQGYMTDDQGVLKTFSTEEEANTEVVRLNGSINSVFTKKDTSAYVIGTVTTDLSAYTVISLSTQAIGVLDAYNALSPYIQDNYSNIIKINESGLYLPVLAKYIIYNNYSKTYYKDSISHNIKIFATKDLAQSYINNIVEEEEEVATINNSYIKLNDYLYSIGEISLTKSFSNVTRVNISSNRISYSAMNSWLKNNIPYYQNSFTSYKNSCTYIDSSTSISSDLNIFKTSVSQDPIEQFAVVQKFPTTDNMFKFSYSANKIIDDMIDITLNYKSGTVVFNETMSFTPGVVDGYGVDQWYTKVDNDYFKIVSLQKVGISGEMLDSYDSDSFGSNVGINPYSVDLMKDTINSIYSYYGDGVDYTVISDSGISNSEYASAIQTIAKNINSCYPASLPAKTKSTTELIAFKNAAALTSPYVRLLAAGSRETVDSFSAVFPGSLHLIRSMINLFRRQGCRFAPNFDIDYGKVSVGQLIQKFTKSEKEILLTNKIEALKQNSDGTFYINDNITAQSKESSLSENQNMLMAISIIHLINDLLPGFKGQFNNIPLRAAIINNISDNISSLLKGEQDKVKVRLICDETNNTINEINNRELVVSLYLQFAPSIKFIFIKDFILSL